jgi:ribosome-associated translation inhibitor RaiA
MENLEFILGMLTTIGVLCIGYTIVGIVKVKKHSKGLDEALYGIQSSLSNIDRELNLQIERVYSEFHRENNDLRIEIHNETERMKTENSDIYRYIDSRFDKFENRIKKLDKEEKQLITD